MPRGVRRPLPCLQCKAEMPEYSEWDGWFRCFICGSKRQES